MAAAYGAYGTTLKIGSTVIATVKNLKGPGLSKETIETTHLLSTSRCKTFISSLRDGGEITADLFFDPVDSSQEALEDNFMGDASATFSIIFSDAAPTTWSASMHVVGIEPSADLGSALMSSVKLKLTGVPTLD